MRSPAEIEEAFSFIIAELVRFSAMGWEELRPHLAEHAFCEIKDVLGRKRIIGKPAFLVLRELSDEALQASPGHRRVDPNRAFACVREGFGKEYARGDFTGTTPEADAEALNRWVNSASEQCKTRTHFIPCQIGMRPGAVFELGPIRFSRREAVWSRLSDDLARYVAQDESRIEFLQKAVEITTEYFGAFSEIAEITVADCDTPTSRAVAKTALQAALDCLHVLAGAGYTEKMRGGGPAIPGDRRSALTLDVDGEVEIAWSISYQGASLGENWFDGFEEPYGSALIAAAAVPIGCIVHCADPELLAERFIDACAWYGDASREPSHAAAVVKYLTAMERLLWAGDKSFGVTNRIAERAAALCFSIETWNMEDVANEVREAYDLRSAILHGRISKADPRILKSVRQCERLARDLITTWIARYGHGFAHPTSLEALQEHFKVFVDSAKAAVAAETRTASSRPA